PCSVIDVTLVTRCARRWLEEESRGPHQPVRRNDKAAALEISAGFRHIRAMAGSRGAQSREQGREERELSEAMTDKRIPFLKMNGLGNDFVVWDAREMPLLLTPAQIRAIGDRRTGIGFDQMITVERSPAGADAFMRINKRD